MRRHLLILALLVLPATAGVGWQVHSATEAAYADGRTPAFACPLAGHSAALRRDR